MKKQLTAPMLSGSSWAAILAVIGVFAVNDGAMAATKEEVMKMVSEEASSNGRVPVPLALAVARVESNFNDKAVSSAGARGVMQMMPSTAMGEFGVPKEQLMDHRLNVRLGIAYLERLYNQYGQDWELALSHYNGGTLHMSGGHFVIHDYNRQYVSDVVRWASTFQADGTALALAGAAGVAGVTLASWQRENRFQDGGRQTRQSEPNWQRVHRAVASTDGDHFLSDMLAESTSELRGRFRASLGSRGGSPEERVAEEENYAVEPVRQVEWPSETVQVQQAAPKPSGRFNYAPYGSGQFL